MSGADSDVVEKMTSGRVERIFREFGINFEELGDGTYRFDVDNVKIVLFNKENTAQLYAAFNSSNTLSRINEWNRTKRLSRAYISKDGNPTIESDVELTGGITEKNFKEWMKTFVVSAKAFRSHISE